MMGLNAYDQSGTLRVALGMNSSAGMSGHVYYGPNGSYEGQVYSIDGALHMIAKRELFFRSFGQTVFQGVVDFSGATVIGL